MEQVEILLNTICGRAPHFRLLVKGKDPSFNISYKIRINKNVHTLSATGTSRRECIRAFYGRLLVFIAKNHVYYGDIVNHLKDKCKV